MECPKCKNTAMVEQNYVWLCPNCGHIEQKTCPDTNSNDTAGGDKDGI